MIVVTGATGQLGRLVIANLLKRVPANQIRRDRTHAIQRCRPRRTRRACSRS